MQRSPAAPGSPAAEPWRSPGAAAAAAYKTPSTKEGEGGVEVRVSRSRNSSFIGSSGDWAVGLGGGGDDGDLVTERDQRGVPAPLGPPLALQQLQRGQAEHSPTGPLHQQGQPPPSRDQAEQPPLSPDSMISDNATDEEAHRDPTRSLTAAATLQVWRHPDGYAGDRSDDAVDDDGSGGAPRAWDSGDGGLATVQGAGVASTGGVLLQARAALAAMRQRQLH